MGYLLPSLRLCNYYCFLFSCCCFFLIMNPTTGTGAGQPSELVSSICKNTTNYRFCVESLYSDPRTPTADSYVLAYVSFDLAYLNASHTEDYIDMLLNNTTADCDSRLLQRLQRCSSFYGGAISALSQAVNDLDSETYSKLARLAGVAVHEACDCEAIFQGHSPFTLSRMNHDLRGLSKICVVISHLFTVSV
ncbi:hypothetical protein CsSME_00009010 [Camellia sinensis var. sinensis]